MKNICFICLSPYRTEIQKAKDRGITHREVFEKYKGLLGYKGKFDSFSVSLGRHLKNHKESMKALVVPQAEQKPANFEYVVKKITELGAMKVENMSPDDLKLRDVWQANKVMIELKKQKLEEDVMMVALSKMFGPVIEGEMEDAEVLNDMTKEKELPKSNEEVLNGIFGNGQKPDDGSKPQNPQ